MASSPSSDISSASIDDLRSRFKQRCLDTDNRHQNWQIRVHRSLSWLERAFETDAEEQPDARLLFDWIAFNAIYGQWDEREGFPVADTVSWKDFLRRILAADDHQVIARRLGELRDPILKLADNKFLDPRLWQDLARPTNLRRRYFEATSLFFEKRWLDLLILAVERIYVLRGQLVHGAATRGSRLNRDTLLQARHVLEQLLVPILEVVIEYGAHDGWPPLCYPPLEDGAPKPSGTPRHAR
jgi:hypothetical protein